MVHTINLYHPEFGAKPNSIGLQSLSDGKEALDKYRRKEGLGGVKVDPAVADVGENVKLDAGDLLIAGNGDVFVQGISLETDNMTGGVLTDDV